VRPQGQTKLGFFPLPVAEARRLKKWLSLPERFSALDPWEMAWRSLTCCMA
jgi:hypothetical protein